MGSDSKTKSYQRVAAQLGELLTKTDDLTARLATVCAVLHHKMPGFFWTGFYVLRDGKLVVGPYQGPLACQVLPSHEGVCWAAIDSGETVIVNDVHAFPGHVACDSRSCSEIVAPLRDAAGQIIGVLDVDSRHLDHFDDVDREGLEAVVALLR